MQRGRLLLSLRDLGWSEVKARKGDWHVVYVDVSRMTAEQIAGEDIFSSYYINWGDTEGLYNVRLRMKNPGRDVIEFARVIADKYHVSIWGGNTEF